MDPYHLVSSQGEWCLIAKCHLRKEIRARTFKLARIKSAVLTKEEYLVPDDFDAERFLQDAFRISVTGEKHQVKLRFKPEVAGWVKEKQWHLRQELRDEPDGSLVMEFPASDLREALSWVMSWGSGVTVLEPRELRDKVREEAKLMAEATWVQSLREERRPASFAGITCAYQSLVD